MGDMPPSRDRETDALATYRAKRAVERTPEPAGTVAVGASAGGLFVGHKHAATRLHYDLRLGKHGALETWALPTGPPIHPAAHALAGPRGLVRVSPSPARAPRAGGGCDGGSARRGHAPPPG